MQKVHVLLVSGDHHGVGKSTYAEWYRRNLVGYPNAVHVPFAGPLKQMLNALGIPPQYFQHPLKETLVPGLGVSTRTLMQTLGTEWGRNTVDPDFWVKLWARRARRLAFDTASREPHLRDLFLYADDVRFPNEVTLLRHGQWPDGETPPEWLTIHHVHVAGRTDAEGALHPSEAYASSLRAMADKIVEQKDFSPC